MFVLNDEVYNMVQNIRALLECLKFLMLVGLAFLVGGQQIETNSDLDW